MHDNRDISVFYESDLTGAKDADMQILDKMSIKQVAY
jgi:hypothetical protein